MNAEQEARLADWSKRINKIWFEIQDFDARGLLYDELTAALTCLDRATIAIDAILEREIEE